MPIDISKAKEGGLQYCSLGSGSKGNGNLVRSSDTLILVDCGFSIKETTKRLAVRGIEPQELSAILVTHEHGDHISGVSRLSNKYSIPVWINSGTNLHPKAEAIKDKNIFNSHDSFLINDIKITPVAVPHDSREAVQFVFSSNGHRLGLLTDVGKITNHIQQSYANCDAIMLEFNYDWQMLMTGRYPLSLKQRVSGGLGHLSNEQAIEFLNQLDKKENLEIIVMHRSEENNSEDLITNLLEEANTRFPIKYRFADQQSGCEWQTISKL